MQPAPEPPPADRKDWTWVLERPCPECGFDSRSFDHRRTGSLIRGNIEKWRAILAGEHAGLTTRPRPDKWSPTEYACHVRDVFRLFGRRLDLMLERDHPAFPDWDQNVTAIEERYDLATPEDVADELPEAGEELASRFDRVSDDQWSRTGVRSDGAEFTVETFARYFLHDPVHHIHDVMAG